MKAPQSQKIEMIKNVERNRKRNENAVLTMTAGTETGIVIGTVTGTVTGAVTEIGTETVNAGEIVTAEETVIVIETGTEKGTVTATEAVTVRGAVTMTGVVTGIVIMKNITGVTRSAKEIGTEIEKDPKKRTGSEKRTTNATEKRKENLQRTKEWGERKKANLRLLKSKNPSARKKISPGPVAGECSA